VMASVGVGVGMVVGFILARTVAGHFSELRVPGAVTLLVSTAVILGAAVIASALPAFRAARVHPAEALRSE